MQRGGAGPRRLVVVAAAARAGAGAGSRAAAAAARRPPAARAAASATAVGPVRAAASATAVGPVRALRLRVVTTAPRRRDALRGVSGVGAPRARRVPTGAYVPARRLSRGRRAGNPRAGPDGARAVARLPRAGARLGQLRESAARGVVGLDGPGRGLQAHVPLLRFAGLGRGGGLRRRHARRRRRLLPGAGALRPVPARVNLAIEWTQLRDNIAS